MLTWLAPLLGLAAYAVGVTLARTPTATLLAWERRIGLEPHAWLPCPVDKEGVPRARAFYCMSGIVIAVLGATVGASLTLIQLLG